MEKGGRAYAKRKKKNEQRKTGGAERNDCFPGSPAEGAETERKELLKQQKEEELRRLAQMMEEQQVSADKLAEILKEARLSRAGA